MRIRILKIWSMRIRILVGSLTIKIKSPNFSKHIHSISLISKSKILLIFKSEPLIRRMFAINLSRLFLYFISQDPWIQMNADPTGSGSTSLIYNFIISYSNIYILHQLSTQNFVILDGVLVYLTRLPLNLTSDACHCY